MVTAQVVARELYVPPQTVSSAGLDLQVVRNL